MAPGWLRACGAGQEISELGRWQRLGEVEALQVVDAIVACHLDLLLCLHPLGDQSQPHAMGEIQDVFDDMAGGGLPLSFP